MKKGLVLMSLLILYIFLLAGCQQGENKINNRNLSHVTELCEDIILQEREENENQEDNTPEEKDKNINDSELLERIHKIKIEEQSFDTRIKGWGEVTFLSCMPYLDDNTNPLTDISFYLTDDEKFLYHFPDVAENNIRTSGLCDGVSFVLIEDINGDAWEDIVIGVLYISGAGPQGMIPYTEIRIYENYYGRKFIYNKSLCDEMNGQLPQDAAGEYVKDILSELKQEEADITDSEYGEKAAEPKTDPDLGEVIFEEPDFALYKDTTKGSYTCQIYNAEGKLVKQKELRSLMVPALDLITDDLVLIVTNAGTNLGFYTYYDRKNNIETETFLNVEAQAGRMIAFMDQVGEDKEVCLIVRDMFDKELYYTEIRRNFMPHICIDMMINSVVFLGGDMMQIEYLDKDSEETVIEIIELS